MGRGWRVCSIGDFGGLGGDEKRIEREDSKGVGSRERAEV
jgi:hypothetical protein